MNKIRKSVVMSIVFVLLLACAAVAVMPIDTVLINEYRTPDKLSSCVSEFTKRIYTDTYIDKQWGIDDMNADVAAAAFPSQITGSGAQPVYVVITDTGVDIKHADLASSLCELEPGVVGYTRVQTIPETVFASKDYTAEPVTVDDYKTKFTGGNSLGADYSIFHGTHIAGTVAASVNNGGVAGIAPKAQIIPIYDSLGTSGNFFEAFRNLIYPKIKAKNGGVNPRVILQVAGGGFLGNSDYDREMAEYAIDEAKKLSDMGVIIVEAVGNSTTDVLNGTKPDGSINYPAILAPSVPNSILVAAHVRGREQMYSNTNYSTSEGSQKAVTISAPGVDIISTGRAAYGEAVNTTDDFFLSTGTSMAAPHVTGACAALWQIFPNATAAQIKEMIVRAAALTGTQKVMMRLHYLDSTPVERQLNSVVQSGFLDLAAAINMSETVLGAGNGANIAIPIKSIRLSNPASGNNIASGQKVQLPAPVIQPFTATNKNLVWTASGDVAGAVNVTYEGGNYFINVSHTLIGNEDIELYAEAASTDYGYKAKSNNLNIRLNGSVPKQIEGLNLSINGSPVANGSTFTTNITTPVTLSFTTSPADADRTTGDVVFRYNGVTTIPSGLTVTGTGDSRSITGSAEGTYNISVTAPNSVVSYVTLVIRDPRIAPRITTNSFVDGAVGVNYTANLTAEGTNTTDDPITWNVTGLPAGISLSGSQITGVPTVSGDFNVNLTATNSKGNNTKALRLVIAPEPVAPTITTASLGNGVLGLAYSSQLAATGTSPEWSIESGTLPKGITLSSSGLLSGIPTESGTFNFTVKAANIKGTDSKELSISVSVTAPVITTSELISGKVNAAYSADLSATGSGIITWSATGLPKGLAVSGNKIVGTPTEKGDYNVTITATNAGGSMSVTLKLTIQGADNPTPTPDGGGGGGGCNAGMGIFGLLAAIPLFAASKKRKS